MKDFLDNYIRYNVPFLALGSIAVLMLIISWIMPPPWQIHSSIIQAAAEIIGIMALWTVHSSVVRGKTATFKKGDVELHIKDDKKEETE